MAAQKMDGGSVDQRKCNGLQDHLEDLTTVFSNVRGVGYMIQVAQLLEVMQVEESEQDAKALTDFEVEYKRAEAESTHEHPKPDGLTPIDGCKACNECTDGEKT